MLNFLKCPNPLTVIWSSVCSQKSFGALPNARMLKNQPCWPLVLATLVIMVAISTMIFILMIPLVGLPIHGPTRVIAANTQTILLQIILFLATTTAGRGTRRSILISSTLKNKLPIYKFEPPTCSVLSKSILLNIPTC